MIEIFAEFTSTFQLLVKGLLVGIIVSAPMGPVGVLCLQRTIQKGRKYGLVTGAGAALSDIIYALITGFGLSFVMGIIENPSSIYVLKLVGSAMLFIFGVYTFRTDPRKCLRPEMKKKGSLFHNFITSFFVTLSNPLIIFLFLALFNMFTFVVPDNLFGQCVGYASILGGAMLWWLGLTHVVDHMKQNFGVRGIQRLNRTIGSVVLVASVIYAMITLFNLSIPFLCL